MGYRVLPKGIVGPPEAAAALGVSPRSGDRAWTYARVFLLAELQKSRD